MCGIYSILQGFDDIDSVGDNRSAARKISAHTMMTIIGGVKLAEMKIVFVEKLKSYRFYDDGLMKLRTDIDCVSIQLHRFIHACQPDGSFPYENIKNKTFFVSLKS